MKIKTMFTITMILFGLILIVTAASLIITNQRVNQLQEQEEIAMNIEREAGDLSYLSNDYLLYREDQQHVRWESKWSSMSKDLARLEQGSPEQQVIVDNIKDNHRRLRAVFDNVASVLQNTTETAVEDSVQSLIQVSWSRLAVQNQGIAFDSLRLSQVIRDRKDQLKQTNVLLIFVLLGAFSAYFVTNYLIIQRRLLKSLADLRAGTEVIGSGKLDFALEVKHNDEVGGLSHAFNQMAVDLKGVTASKTELEREIIERKRAEEERARYQRLLEEQNEELRVSAAELLVAQDTLTESNRLSDTLNDINATLNSTLDIDKIMQQVLAEGADAIGSELSAVILREDNHWLLKYVSNIPRDMVGMRTTREQSKDLEYVTATEEVLLIEDTSTDKRVNREFLQGTIGIQSAMILPLPIKGEVVGALVFGYRSFKRSFNEAQIDFAKKLAASISLALENARLYEAERQIANTLQETLLTMPERIGGIEFGHLYRSATETAKVGGDFYDVFELECGKAGIVIGDVSGKGLKAATLTALVRNTIRAYAYEEELPSEILKKANNAMKQTIKTGNFVTLFLGIVDIRSKELLYCSAGHPAALLRRKRDGIEFLEANSPIIGAFASLDYTDSTVVIKPGDTLLLYTDGITEARYDGEFFTEERLVETLGNLGSMPTKDIPAAIFSVVMKYTGGKLADDIALLCISLSGIKGSSHV